MVRKKSVWWPIQLSSAIIALVGVSSFAQVQSYPIPFEMPPIIISRFPPPPDNGTPGNTVGGGIRRTTQECGIEIPLIALAPTFQEPEPNQVWSQTTKESPSLFFYVPYKPENIKSVEFRLSDSENVPVYKTRNIQIVGTPGLLRIQLPSRLKNGQPLELDKNYKWNLYLDINCDSSSSGIEPERVSGWLQRVERPELDRSLNLAETELERVNLYFEEEIWQDTLTLLAELRARDMKNNEVTSQWNKLMEDVLSDINIEAMEDVLSDINIEAQDNPEEMKLKIREKLTSAQFVDPVILEEE
ncbi:DUF928 domain-containing protein [Phormidium sp. CCY1219]|uniref:DUF928 domain-containing protein n=1 Tax=Phormidium sp. CCY1219 TaxID=2886104 RepID=UPI002D1F393E|nr:DUF928 domain-containing protein [Phormidium sp. CCY1219]MEB3829438.1 DUF928 domain-containing protein [Phormidium sp. CCY1219]